MKINGFQKLTLLDFPGKMACIVFTPGCNFRCPFCHNASLVTHINEVSVSEEEIFTYLARRKGLLDGVVVTGGEPLLQSGLEDFLTKVKSLGYAVKLDTNGSFPSKLKALVNKGLVDYVAMDVKNSREKYARTIGVNNPPLDEIDESIKFLISGEVDYEFRTTVTAGLHTSTDIEKIAEWIKGAKKYFLQNFVDSGDLVSEGNEPVTSVILNEMTAKAKQKGVPAKAR